MSSRCNFTSSYIYHKEAGKEIAERLSEMGYGVTCRDNGSQVTGMIKGAEYDSNIHIEIEKVINEVKDKYDIGYPITIAFVSDDYGKVFSLSTEISYSGGLGSLESKKHTR